MDDPFKQPWLGPYLEWELNVALDYWNTAPAQRATIKSSQLLEAMFEDDGSNLRIKCRMSLADNGLVQIVEFTHADEDEPVEAIVSDAHNSVKVRFSKVAETQFYDAHKRPITHGTEYGIMHIDDFEIIVSQYGSGNEDRIFLLITSLKYQGSGGPRVIGSPKPIQQRREMAKILYQFLKIKPEKNIDEVTHSAEEEMDEAQDEMLSQGEPEPCEDESSASQTQFRTQIACSQAAPHVPNLGIVGGVNLAGPQAAGFQQTTNRQPLRTKAPNGLMGLLARGPAGGLKETIHIAPPRIARRPQSSDDNFIDDDIPMANDDDGNQVKIANAVVNNEPGDTEDSPPRRQQSPINTAKPPKKDRSVGDMQTINATQPADDVPTSYQPPEPILDSTNPSTISGIPSVIQSVEKEAPEAAVHRREIRGPREGPWKSMWPITRSACKIPADQAAILSSSNSFFPPAPGQTFPPGNMPVSILKDLCDQAERRVSKAQMGSSNRDTASSHPDNADNLDGDREKIDPNNSDAVETESPPSTFGIDIPWSSSPARPTRRIADLPPDSSLPEKQATAERPQPRGSAQDEGAQESSNSSAMDLDRHVESQRAGHEPTVVLGDTDHVSRRGSPEIPSSPPSVSQNTQLPDDTMDEDDSELEMSLPKSYAQVDEVNSPRVPTSKAPANNMFIKETSYGRGDANNFMMRHISSPGASTSHLPGPVHQEEVTASPSSAKPVSDHSGRSHFGEIPVSSSAVLVPCSSEVPRPSPHSLARKLVGLDGAAESKLSLSDQEDALLEQQIQNEIETQSSLRREVASASTRDQHPASRSDMDLSSSDKSPSQRHIRNTPIKREAASPSDRSRKKRKISRPNFHFSQENPASQDPATCLREQRRLFLAKLKQEKDGNNDGSSGPSRRPSRNHSGSSDSEPDAVPRPNVESQGERILRRQRKKVMLKVEQEEGENDQISSTQSRRSYGTAPSVKVKVEPCEDGHATSSDGELNAPETTSSNKTGDNHTPTQSGSQLSCANHAPGTGAQEPTQHSSQNPDTAEETCPPDQIMEDAPAETMFQLPTPAPVPNDTQSSHVVEETVLPARNDQVRSSQPNPAEAYPWQPLSTHESHRSIRGNNDGMAKSNQAARPAKNLAESEKEPILSAAEEPARDKSKRETKRAENAPWRESESKRKMDPNSGQAEHSTGAPFGSRLLPLNPNSLQASPRNEKPDVNAHPATGAYMPEGPISNNVMAESLRALQVKPMLSSSHAPSARVGLEDMSNDDIFTRFTRAYPEYTGNRKHFENLCGQLDWLRQENRMLPVFLWDDYIICSKVDYRIYTNECTDTGRDPLPYHRFYTDEIKGVKFDKKIITPEVLRRVIERDKQILRRDMSANTPPLRASSHKSPGSNHEEMHAGRRNTTANMQPPRVTSGSNSIPINNSKIKPSGSLPQDMAYPLPTRPPAQPSSRPPVQPFSRPPAAAPEPIRGPSQTKPAPTTRAAQPARRPAATPASPGSKSGADRPRKENVFTIFKQRYKKPRPEGSRAGSAAPEQGG